MQRRRRRQLDPGSEKKKTNRNQINPFPSTTLSTKFPFPSPTLPSSNPHQSGHIIIPPLLLRFLMLMLCRRRRSALLSGSLSLSPLRCGGQLLCIWDSPRFAYFYHPPFLCHHFIILYFGSVFYTLYEFSLFKILSHNKTLIATNRIYFMELKHYRGAGATKRADAASHSRGNQNPIQTLTIASSQRRVVVVEHRGAVGATRRWCLS
jgi:hypothetical protein